MLLQVYFLFLSKFEVIDVLKEILYVFLFYFPFHIRFNFIIILYSFCYNCSEHRSWQRAKSSIIFCLFANIDIETI